ncbi:hypothetical protein TWF696_002776 [Orbilia brochopaga]|uniref:DnaJ homologue subfamily C member 28 conserved domain-containing protein n=1 Tax=Orbilia brochopaga TaxID=3140254 RepID=A0AAV9U126_9PEZI
MQPSFAISKLSRSLIPPSRLCPAAAQTRFLKSSLASSNSQVSRLAFARNLSQTCPNYALDSRAEKSSEPTGRDDDAKDDEGGAMRQRLEDLAEQSKLAEPRKHIRELEAQENGAASAETSAGLEALKARLADKIQAADFKSENAAAVAYAQLSDAAGKETRDTAMARPWTGAESLEDAVLRSLHESTPRLKSVPKAATSRSSMPTNLAPMRRMSKNERIVSARDRAGSYPLFKKAESELNDEEREARSRMFKERFEPGSRAMPNTVQGLAALANEKIEEAISKGLFKNLPKGPVERDHHAESPFIDTTEYLLNRMIQRQEIVPPWIEKQQELQKEVRAFRSRIRADWKRHVVRTIASWGGGPNVWIKRAEEYARAEGAVNPDPIAAYDESTKPKGRGNKWRMDGTATQIGEEITLSETAGPEPVSDVAQDPEPDTPVVPFRDSNWEKNEYPYHEVSINNINAITRSYNLQAPRVAQRPFLNLKREILSCYRDVMPSVPAEMLERANNPNYGKAQLKLGSDEDLDAGDKGLLELLSTSEKGRVYDESASKAYGFKQFWRDLFSRT